MSHPEDAPQPDLPESRWSLVPLHGDIALVRAELQRAKQELAATRAEAAATSERLHTLLGMAAHDLRNPAGAVRGFAETLQLLTRDRLEPRELDLLERIVATSNRMLRIVQELLDLAEIEHEDVPLDLEHCDLRAVVDDALEVARIAAGDKDITVGLDAPTALPLVADPDRLNDVLLNLLSNAVKYSRRGSDVMVTVDTDDDAGTVRIAVADHGIGIAEVELPDLFEAFTRASGRPTEGEASTGLGLTIADRIVRAHGGELTVTSTLGEGSVFTVTLPRSSRDDEATPAPVRVSPRSDSPRPSTP